MERNRNSHGLEMEYNCRIKLKKKRSTNLLKDMNIPQ